MGWVKRGAFAYYLHVYRDSDGRLRSVYCGTGARAEEAAKHYEWLRQERLEWAAKLRSRRSQLRADERAINDYCKHVNKLQHA
jgi:hypothetical protein